MNPDTAIIAAHLPEHIPEVRAMFREYAGWLGFDLCFQDFESELAGLPGAYAPPAGRLFLARCDDAWAGCVGLRRFEGNICEMKRLYVRPAFRGRGVGRILAVAVIDAARLGGYARMRLDTITSMAAANGLYERLGFHDIGPYRPNPIQGARYMELVLSAEDPSQPT
jgi:putative acetyltransferase